MKPAKQALRVAAFSAQSGSEPHRAEFVNRLFDPGDRITFCPGDAVPTSDRIDLAVVLHTCSPTALAENLARASLPCLSLAPSLVFHAYMADFRRSIERAGGILLPSDNPDDVSAAIEAVRAAKLLRRTTLLSVEGAQDDAQAHRNRRFAEARGRLTGMTIIRRPAGELKERATSRGDEEADEELRRRDDEVFEEPPEADRAHMRRVAKLYLAEKEMLEETGAAGISVAAIRGFLTADRDRREIMPTVSLGPLAFDGCLVAEEDDPGAPASQMLLRAGLGAAPMETESSPRPVERSAP